MRYRFAKSSLCSAIALVLVYYSVAWAVLRCSHDDDFANAEVTADASADSADSSSSFHTHDGAHLDCMGSDYHTETLAGVSGSVEKRVLSTDIVYHAADLSNLHDTGTVENGNLWLSALFDDGPLHSSPIGLPLYLSISVLRI
ncbi:MAG TPA: hypothetical protein VJQ25_06280 [Nitrospira sp.]|nr:hypothetical protein [Nitrospira sp.]